MAKRKTPELIAAEAAEQVDKALVVVNALRVKTQEDYDEGMRMLQEIKRQQASLTESEKSITDPLNQAIKATKKLFNVPKNRLATADAAVRSAMKVFAEEAKAKADKIKAKLAAGKVRSVAQAVTQIEDTNPGGTSTRKVLEIVDETKIPKAYFKLVLDKDKVKESWKNGLPVPGTTYEDAVTIVVRS